MKKAKNLDVRIDGDKMILTIDLSQKQGISKSGKSETIATSGGFADLEDIGKPGITLNVTCFKPIKKNEPIKKDE